MQFLQLPFKSTKASAGYKNSYYLSQWKCNHYGIDVVSGNGDRNIYGMGNGTVVLAGCDGVGGRTTGTGSGCGNVLVIVYKDVDNWSSGKHYDVTVTLMHLEKIYVKVGQTVTKDDIIAKEGNTGAMTSGTHLHIQVDTDTKYYQYCTGLSSKGHALLKKGTSDSTVNPIHVLHIGPGRASRPMTQSGSPKPTGIRCRTTISGRCLIPWTLNSPASVQKPRPRHGSRNATSRRLDMYKPSHSKEPTFATVVLIILGITTAIFILMQYISFLCIHEEQTALITAYFGTVSAEVIGLLIKRILKQKGEHNDDNE